jgi:hypothetical protein
MTVDADGGAVCVLPRCHSSTSCCFPQSPTKYGAAGAHHRCGVRTGGAAGDGRGRARPAVQDVWERIGRRDRGGGSGGSGCVTEAGVSHKEAQAAR